MTDVLAYYGEQKAPQLAHPELVGYHMTPLLKFWGDKTCWQIGGETCREYATQRTTGRLGRVVKAGTARRELETLNAAIQFAFEEKKLSQPMPVTYPEKAPSRTRWLTRSEVAALLAGALGISATLYDIKTRKPLRWGRIAQPSYHVARFILVGVYTGTRHEANLQMRWGVNSKGGWFDLERGVLYRRGDGEADTNKRRVPAPIPDRLRPHLLRWRRMTTIGPVEYAGRLIIKERKGWDRAATLAGLGDDVTPHVLKHTCITWMLQSRVPIREVAGFTGTTEKVIETTYGHHSPDHLNAARTASFGRNLGGRK